MANFYKKNINTFKEGKPFGERIELYLNEIQITEEHIRVVEGMPYFEEQGNFYQMYSENQLEEREYYIRDVEPFRDYFLLVFGIANVSLLRKLKDCTSDGTRILVIEKNPYVMKYIFLHNDLTDLIKHPKFVISCGDDQIMEATMKVCMAGRWDNLVQNLKVIALAHYCLYKEFKKNILKMVTRNILMAISSLGNSLEDVMNGMENCYKNVDACMEANGIRQLKDKFKGIPGIVVGGGPSLDKNVDLLKEAEGKAVIITTDAAYRACERIGVKPDAIASIERDKPTYDYFYKDRTFDEDVVLAGPNLLWPDIFKEYPGKKLIMTKTKSGPEGWWGGFFPMTEHLETGFSCSNVAHAVLDEMGCNPIIFIGQDLAYTGNKRHSEDSKYFENNELNEEQKNKINMCQVEDIYGDKVLTSDTFNLFRHCIEERIFKGSTMVIDATEGGAKIDGSHIMTFREAIDTYCQKEKPYSMNDCLEKIVITKDDRIDKYREILKGTDKIIKDLEDIKARVTEHCAKINPYADFDFEKASFEQLVEVVKVMQEGNFIFDYIVSEKKHLVTFYQANLKQTVVYVKKIGNDVTAETVKRNWELQEHLMYLMEITTSVVKEQYLRIHEYIQEKIDKEQGNG